MPSGIAKALLCVAAALALQACASWLSSKDGAQALPPLVPGKGRVVLYRTSTIGTAYTPDVLLNGEKVGRPNRRGVFFRDVPPGSYAVTTTMTSKVINFSMAAGEKKYIRFTSGLLDPHLQPELVDPARGEAEAAGLSHLGQGQK